MDMNSRHSLESNIFGTRPQTQISFMMQWSSLVCNSFWPVPVKSAKKPPDFTSGACSAGAIDIKVDADTEALDLVGWLVPIFAPSATPA